MSLLPERRHEVSRVEAFSDAVFAFALTLLVVALDVPKSYAELRTLMAGFVPFACSFALLTWIWYEHNVFFRRYGLQDGYTVAVNAGLLFVVLFYVYPLKFLFTAAFSFFIPALRPGTVPMSVPELASLFAIYGAGFVILFLMFGLLYLRVYRQRDVLGLSRLEVMDVKIAAGAHMVSVAIGGLSVAIALFGPGYTPMLAGFTYFLMGPAHWIYGRTMGRRRQAAVG
jgi:uncharacterized membrane protein